MEFIIFKEYQILEECLQLEVELMSPLLFQVMSGARIQQMYSNW